MNCPMRSQMPFGRPGMQGKVPFGRAGMQGVRRRMLFGPSGMQGPGRGMRGGMSQADGQQPGHCPACPLHSNPEDGGSKGGTTRP
jgi:hypothetical protein